MCNKNEYILGRVFGKTFTLRTGWSLPNPEDMFTEPPWQLNDLQNLKTTLNRTKQKLNLFDLDQWHAHTTKMNPAGLVINHIRKHVRPDFLTQAWCKFYEIAYSSPLFPRDAAVNSEENSLFTVHLCEAPGAFVSALNHYMAINHEGLRLKWLAMTLNPYHEANGHPDIVSDDRLILNTLDNWEFGPDYTGDIFQPGYADHLHRTVLRRFSGEGVGLVTADGSIDCSDNPGEQENIVMRLHNYETMVALNVLRKGGSLVQKMFTTFECGSVCRMYLLCTVFQSVIVRKPATSKPGNSEVYVVCTGYLGRETALPFIRKFFAANASISPGVSDTMAMFPLSQIPSEFRTELRRCSEYYSRLQIETIENNIKALSCKEDSYREIETRQWSVCINFVARYGLRPIRYNQELMSSSYKPPKVRVYNCKRRGWSYVEKIRMHHLAPEQEADMLYREVVDSDEWKIMYRVRDVCWGYRTHITVRLSDVEYHLGKPVTVIKGSKFCNESLIHFRRRVLSKFPSVPSTTSAESRSLYYHSKLDLRPENTAVCDLTDICAEHGTNNTAVQQYHCLESMMDALCCKIAAASVDSLLLIGYPLYTQMSVACFFAVTSMFDRFGLIKPHSQYGHAIVFTGYKRHDGWLNALATVKNLLPPEANNGLSLISWVPIKVLLKQKVYADLVTVNNLCIVNEIKPVLSSFLGYIS
ncbi:Adrift-type ribose 2-O-methyltransferase domain,Ribosomal RNA methyltransferase FtsJ domain,S- [Cinara cedri]|uniref:Cap-specific mRNA (nucleoside-2'-O-)-methyltransferase 2 n=1 Tax=Cinara cedri TaxID=506608 RepID=A0A5E4M167_9HEMI|nr:Adrift-type ribose 2-O-methyltransferase domain,Ribosomal RNA methyltransferase FtsJ domain,S- [Cinara cedri]